MLALQTNLDSQRVSYCSIPKCLRPWRLKAYKLSSLVGLALTPSGGVCEIAFKSDRSLSDAADVLCMSISDAHANLAVCRSRYWLFNSARSSAGSSARVSRMSSHHSLGLDLPCLDPYTAWHCIMAQQTHFSCFAMSYSCIVLGNLQSRQEVCMVLLHTFRHLQSRCWPS